MTEDPAIPTLEVVGRRGQKTAPCEDLVTETRRILLDVAGGRVPEVEAAHRLARGWLERQRGGGGGGENVPLTP